MNHRTGILLIIISTALLPIPIDAQYQGDGGYFLLTQQRLDMMPETQMIISNYSEVVIDKIQTTKTFEIYDVKRVIIQQSSFVQENATGFYIHDVDRLQILSSSFEMRNGTVFDLEAIQDFDITQNSIYSTFTPLIVSSSKGLINYNYLRVAEPDILSAQQSDITTYQNWIQGKDGQDQTIKLEDSSYGSIYDLLISGYLNISSRDKYNLEQQSEYIKVTTVNNYRIHAAMEYGLPSIAADIMGKHTTHLRVYNNTGLVEDNEVNQIRVSDTSYFQYALTGNLTDQQQNYDVQLFLKGVFEASYWFNNSIQLEYGSDSHRMKEIRDNSFGLGTYRCPQQLPEQYCEADLFAEELMTTSIITTMSELDVVQDFMDSPYGIIFGFVGLIMMISKGGQYLNKKQ